MLLSVEKERVERLRLREKEREEAQEGEEDAPFEKRSKMERGTGAWNEAGRSQSRGAAWWWGLVLCALVFFFF